MTAFCRRHKCLKFKEGEFVKKKKRSDKSQLIHRTNHMIGLFDEEPRTTSNEASKKGDEMNVEYIKANRIRKRILNFNRASQRGIPFIGKQSYSFKKSIILLAVNNSLLDKDFVQAFYVLTTNRRVHSRESGLVRNMSDSPHLDLIFVYAVEKIFQAIRTDDLLILGPADPRLKFTEKFHKQSRKMMTIKQLNDCLDSVYTYISRTGLGRTDDRSRKDDLKRAYSMYLALIKHKDYKDLTQLDEFRVKGLLFICISLFLKHDSITAEIVDELGLSHKAMVPDPRIFYKVAKKTKPAEPGDELLTFLEAFIYQVLEAKHLPKV